METSNLQNLASEADSLPDGARLIRVVGPGSANTKLLHDRRLVRLDALRVMIGALIDQIDDLANEHEPDEDTESVLQSMVRRFEIELIQHALLRTGGKQRPAARLLGEKKTTLNAKIVRYGINIEDLIGPSDRAPARSASPEEPTIKPEITGVRSANPAVDA